MFYLRYFDTTSEYQQEESALSSNRPSLGYTEDNEGFHWFPYLRTLSITGMSLTDFGDVTTASTGHWTQSFEGEDATYEGQLVIVGSNLDLISALTISTVNCNVITSVASRKRNRKVYNVTLTVTDLTQAASVVFSYGDVDLSAEYTALDYSTMYFTTRALENSTTFTLTIGNNFPKTGATGLQYIKYSTNNGTTWTTVNNTSGSVNTKSVTVNAGESVLWQGSGNTLSIATAYTSTSGVCRITSDKQYEVLGNLMSLFRESFVGVSFNTGYTTPCRNLFAGDTRLVNAEHLVIQSEMIPANGCSFMFQNCSALLYPPMMPQSSSGVNSNAYYAMFSGCTSLEYAPNLLSSTIPASGYAHMFRGCTSLETPPVMSATSLSSSGYNCHSMFSGCTRLQDTPTLNISTMRQYCYCNMFVDCQQLKLANIHVRVDQNTLNTRCYQSMFAGCTSLEATPTLSSNTLVDYCYYNMFADCTSLTATTTLPKTALAISCYNQMFRNCTSLTTAPSLPATGLYTDCYSHMFSGCTNLTTVPVISATGVGISSCESMFVGCTRLTTSPELNFTFVNSGGCKYMFAKCTSLTAATPTLPATSLTQNEEYFGMFSGCTSLKTAPAISATTISVKVFANMFEGCTSLTTAPVLPATALTSGCYDSMFASCTSLTTAPALSATTLATSAYTYMFYRCTKLTTAPVLPATTLANYCYSYMFSGCTKLNYIKAMFTTTPSTSYTRNWVSGVASSGTFVKNSAATWNVTGVNGIPTNWTVQTASS